MNARRCAAILLTIAAQYVVAAPIASSQNLSKKWVEKTASPLVKKNVVDGLSIGYIEGDHFGIVHLGSANEAKKKADFTTVYEIGSIGKLFTSLLLADAVVRGEIDLNAPAEVANAAGIRLPSRKGRSIQWIDLSTHRSGLPRLPSNLAMTDPLDPYRDYDSTKAAEFLNHYELPRQPGAAQEYSNLGGAVLGYLLAEKAGKTYDELLRERITGPLGMTDCTVALSDEQKKRLATPHSHFGLATPLWTCADLPGAGGAHATMRDMMRFAKAQLDSPEGKLGEAIEMAWKQHTPADDSGPPMGLGWMIAGDGETRWHNGGTGGSSSAIFINRRLKSAVIVLANTSVSDVLEPLAVQVIQKAAGLESNAEPAEPKGNPPTLSPFTAVRFEGDKVIVNYEGRAYQWLALDGITIEDIVASSKEQFGDRWQRRLSEDLVEVLWGMKHRPRKTVRLRLRDLETKQDSMIAKAPMTRENRDAVRANRPPADAGVNEGPDKQVIDAAFRRRLVGRYQLTPDFIFDVQDRDGHLLVGITNQPTQEVFPDSPTRWSYRGVDATLEFQLPKTGRAKSLVLHQNGNSLTAPRIN